SSAAMLQPLMSANGAMTAEATPHHGTVRTDTTVRRSVNGISATVPVATKPHVSWRSAPAGWPRGRARHSHSTHLYYPNMDQSPTELGSTNEIGRAHV